MTKSLGYSGAKSRYHSHMRRFAFLLRLLIVTAFAAGFGLPMHAKAQVPAHHVMHMDHSAHLKQMPLSETCREHCLGLSMLVAPIAPLRPAGPVVPVYQPVQNDRAASLWPQPQGRPPRI